ncbi:hypothetical protein DL95DRAFT_47346 [Leptodontidium sp. 2 PMI_412]|nr:hypothetical protein DL95DRAFT_47346 [Leptodontidium sp. 2 PMI_412]
MKLCMRLRVAVFVNDERGPSSRLAGVETVQPWSIPSSEFLFERGGLVRRRMGPYLPAMPSPSPSGPRPLDHHHLTFIPSEVNLTALLVPTCGDSDWARLPLRFGTFGQGSCLMKRTPHQATHLMMHCFYMQLRSELREGYIFQAMRGKLSGRT